MFYIDEYTNLGGQCKDYFSNLRDIIRLILFFIVLRARFVSQKIVFDFRVLSIKAGVEKTSKSVARLLTLDGLSIRN